ncbi:MAG: aldo/keto reductase, partial [Pseudomonadota bacterium]|nr:aldo/keto reductase [Pseudomonadota bacterium]
MELRELGSTGINVSPIGLGTVKLGRNQGVKYPQGFELPDDAHALRLINLAKEHGINLIDTAPAYGISEERLGVLLKGQRQDWVICSKVGEEFSNGESHFDFSPEHARFSIERSLKRLNTDVIDLVLVHSDGNDLDIINGAGTLDALAELKRQGLIRAFG